MGTWGTALFSNDSACDIRGHYTELIEDGVDDAEAQRQTLEKFQAYFGDPEDRVLIVAFAVTQSKIGRLDPGIRDRAIAVIDSGGDLAIWEKDNPKLAPKRREVLARARAQLTGLQPARKRLRPPKRKSCGLAAGDVLGLAYPGGLALLRIVKVISFRTGETPVIEQLDYSGADVPSKEVLRGLPTKTSDPIGFTAENSRFRFTAFDMRRRHGERKLIGWQDAGFVKLANLPARPGDDAPGSSSSGVAWFALAEQCQGRNFR